LSYDKILPRQLDIVDIPLVVVIARILAQPVYLSTRIFVTS